MTDATRPHKERGNRLRWLMWSGYLTLLTAALVTPQPTQAARQVLTETPAFVTAKIVHVAAYAVLAMLTGWLRPSRHRWLFMAALVLHALGTEYVQQFVPLRTGSWRDVGLDLLGIALGTLLTWNWWREARPPASEPAAPAGSDADGATAAGETGRLNS
ncbi:MAG: VanZ family protein [Gemmataceae bacterium]|nr:VanZ family protein [Gemmataceae bacterium]MDW8265762.1 VanZ family protein [Gemmataceae bacterium]